MGHTLRLSLNVFMVHEYERVRELERKVAAYVFTLAHLASLYAITVCLLDGQGHYLKRTGSFYIYS